MRTTYKALLAGAALASVGTAAQAQFPLDLGAIFGQGSSDRATLYEYPNFQGRSVTVMREQSNLSSAGFNDRARSIRATGTWRLCEDSEFRSRCTTIQGSVNDLSRTGIHGLSSIRYEGAGGNPGYPGGGYGQGVPGQSTVFYPGPAAGNYSTSSSARRRAEDFCRSMGHRSVAYYDTYQRTVSDVLCRR